jgi:DedD protein
VEDDERERIDISETNIPPRPDLGTDFESEVLPDTDQPLITPLPNLAPPAKDSETAEELPLESAPALAPAPAPTPPPPILESTPDPEALAEQPQSTPPREPQQAPIATPAVAKLGPAKATPSPVTQNKTAAPPPPPQPSQKPAQQTKAPASPPPAGTGLYAWVIQVGSFASRERADGLVQRLRKEGYPAFQEQAYVSKRIMYRVRIGPGSDRKRTEQMAQQLADRLGLQGSVTRYP